MLPAVKLSIFAVTFRCNRRDVDTTRFKVEDLTEGDEYEFRVVAYNEAGASRPSTTAGPVTIQDQTCKTSLLHQGITLQDRLHNITMAKLPILTISPRFHSVTRVLDLFNHNICSVLLQKEKKLKSSKEKKQILEMCHNLLLFCCRRSVH